MRLVEFPGSIRNIDINLEPRINYLPNEAQAQDPKLVEAAFNPAGDKPEGVTEE